MNSGYTFTLDFKPCSEKIERGKKILFVEKNGDVLIGSTENKFCFCIAADCYGSYTRFDTEKEFSERVKSWAYLDGISEAAR